MSSCLWVTIYVNTCIARYKAIRMFNWGSLKEAREFRILIASCGFIRACSWHVNRRILQTVFQRYYREFLPKCCISCIPWHCYVMVRKVDKSTYTCSIIKRTINWINYSFKIRIYLQISSRLWQYSGIKKCRLESEQLVFYTRFENWFSIHYRIHDICP